MSRRRVAIVMGTRPEAVKLAPVVLALRHHPTLAAHVCVTAQHRGLLDQVLQGFGIVPDVDLDLMRPRQTLAMLTGRVLEHVDGYLREHRPELVLVQGDTTTVAATALAAFYAGIPVGHVEAGLRTGDRRSPFPEEMNRLLATRLADHHFAPTAAARDNLLREGVRPDCVHLTGNTGIDALLHAVELVRREPPVIPGLPAVALEGGPLVLVTGHRRESFGAGLASICDALAEVAARFPRAQLVYPVHPNPQVQEPVRRALSGRANVHLLAPLDYLPFVSLLDRATLVLTDSGGVQEEAPTLGRPLLVMRDATERPEAIAAGNARLVGTCPRAIVSAVEELLTDPARRRAMSRPLELYGDGTAARRIVETCAAALQAPRFAAA